MGFRRDADLKYHRDMNSAEELRRLQERYAGMSDGELEAIAAKGYELTEEAQSALHAELGRRRLDIEITTAPPPASTPRFADLVTIRRYHDFGMAMIAKSLLENAGIECYMADENTVRIDWLYLNAIGGMRLQVRAEDAEKAIALLDSPWVLPKESDAE